MVLPLPVVLEIDLLDNDEIILGWIDARSFQTEGVRREREWDSDGHRRIIVSETPVHRIIHIDGRIDEEDR
jgi:hypothetical protein